MLKVHKGTYVPSKEERLNILQRHTNNYGIPIDYDRVLEYITQFGTEAAQIREKLCKVTGLTSIGKSEFLYFLQKNGLTEGFEKTETGGISLKKESIKSFIETNRYPEEINKIVMLYQRQYSLDHHLGQLRTLVKDINERPSAYSVPGALETEEGRRIVIVKGKWVIQNTGRIGITEPAFMNFPREMKDLMVAPKGFKLLSSDSSQIEPKLINALYIQNEQLMTLFELYGDAYFGYIHYVTMPESDLRSGTLDFKKMELTEDMVKNRSKFKTWGNAVVYGSTRNVDNDPLLDAYIKRIGQNENRVSKVKEAEDKILRGDYIFHTYFGTPIDIRLGGLSSNKKKASLAIGTPEYMRACLNAAINNPVQGTAADLMGICINTVDKYLQQENIPGWIPAFIHDDLKLIVHESTDEKHIKFLEGATSYEFDNGLKVYNDPKWGRKFNKDVFRIY